MIIEVMIATITMTTAADIAMVEMAAVAATAVEETVEEAVAIEGSLSCESCVSRGQDTSRGRLTPNPTKIESNIQEM